MKKWFRRLSPLVVAGLFAGILSFMAGPASATSNEITHVFDEDSGTAGWTDKSVTADSNGVATIIVSSSKSYVGGQEQYWPSTRLANNVNSVTNGSVSKAKKSDRKTVEITFTLNGGASSGTFQVYYMSKKEWVCPCNWVQNTLHVTVSSSSNSSSTTTTEDDDSSSTTTTEDTSSSSTTTTAAPVKTYVTIKFADTYGVGGEDVTISNLCVTNSTNSNGADVNLQTCDGGDDQKWEAVSFGTGTQYKNKSTGKCIDNRGNAFGKKQINVWSCIASTHGAAPNQRFTIDSSGYVKSANGYWLIDNSTLNGNGTSSTKMKFSTS